MQTRMKCYGLYHDSPKRYVEVLTLSTYLIRYFRMWPYLEVRHLFIDRLIDFRGNQIKMRSLGWALIQCDWCPYKKVKFGHKCRPAQREDSVKMHREKMAMWLEWCIYKPRNAKDCQQTLEAGRGKEGFLPRDIRRNMACWHLDFRFLASRIVRQ